MLTSQHITAFQALWRKHYGEDISRDRALEESMRLLRFVGLANGIDLNMKMKDYGNEQN